MRWFSHLARQVFRGRARPRLTHEFGVVSNIDFASRIFIVIVDITEVSSHFRLDL